MRRRIAMAGAALTLAGTATVAATAGSGAQDPQSQPHLVPMEEISVPIIDGDRLDGAFRVHLVLATTDAAAADRVSKDMPRLRSASLAAALEFSRLYASPMRAVNAQILSDHLTEALQQEDGGIARALIIKVAARPA